MKYSKIFLGFWECRADFLMSQVFGNRWPCVPEYFFQNWLCYKLQMLTVRYNVWLNTSCLCSIWRRKQVYVYPFSRQWMQYCLDVTYLFFRFIFWEEAACTIILGFCIFAPLKSFELGVAFQTNLTIVELEGH